jgi:hypothetical protein
MLEALLALALNTPSNSTSTVATTIPARSNTRYEQGPTLPLIAPIYVPATIPTRKEQIKLEYKIPNTFSITFDSKYVHIKIAPRFYNQKQNSLICSQIPY